ncbi:hypothetical protein ISN44_As08g001190 [Arabidopsis suecica]|uniref:F-box domain-containing protein n=1 Tax=Arabidopsis suecica TaxID=45249 RepID=A0A8T2B372_ARASU|nr:hypothetical protein ISN44_As08g001190 [Arabidopsis suecica]
MGQSKKKANRRRQEEKEANWSELCPDLLRGIFKRLSFTALNRAKSVCSWWYSASRGCVPNQNQIPWLILFPHEEESNKNSSSCVLFVPEDQDKVYTSKNLGVDFAQSRCLTTCGSWLLMLNLLRDVDVYILNPLTGERIDLPDIDIPYARNYLRYNRACFRIDNKTKDYLVVMLCCRVFTKKGYNKWQKFPHLDCYEDFVYDHKHQKLYIRHANCLVNIWDLSGDNPRKDGTRTAVTVSGEFFMVSSIVQGCKTWHFHIYKKNQVDGKLVKVDSLGDEALIYDMGITVAANGIPGIKKNSIYFSGLDHDIHNRDHILVFDLTTRKIEPLPQCVFSSIRFSDARWFFPC